MLSDAVAPGWAKVILVGEHAVVHGQPAIAGALKLGVFSRFVPSQTSAQTPLRLSIPAWNIDVGYEDDHPIAQALRQICQASDHVPTSGTIVCDATVLCQAGLGSSAALAVSLARLLQKSSSDSQTAKNDRLFQVAMTAERLFHGNPSGIDVACALHGGWGIFSKTDGWKPLACPPLQMVIGLTGQTRQTLRAVGKVGDAARDNAACLEIFSALGALSQKAAVALVSTDTTALGAILNDAQRLLSQLHVSSPHNDAMVKLALGAGAKGAKLTGAGLGGAVIALAPGLEDSVIAAWKNEQYQSFTQHIGAIP